VLGVFGGGGGELTYFDTLIYADAVCLLIINSSMF